MRGILSSAPPLGSIRLLLGGKILLLIQAWLVVLAEHLFHGVLTFVVGVVAVIGLIALIFAIIGEPEEAADDHKRAWRRVGGRRS
jgi:hypothetical protein